MLVMDVRGGEEGGRRVMKGVRGKEREEELKGRVFIHSVGSPQFFKLQLKPH